MKPHTRTSEVEGEEDEGESVGTAETIRIFSARTVKRRGILQSNAGNVYTMKKLLLKIQRKERQKRSLLKTSKRKKRVITD